MPFFAAEYLKKPCLCLNTGASVGVVVNFTLQPDRKGIQGLLTDCNQTIPLASVLRRNNDAVVIRSIDEVFSQNEGTPAPLGYRAFTTDGKDLGFVRDFCCFRRQTIAYYQTENGTQFRPQKIYRVADRVLLVREPRAKKPKHPEPLPRKITGDYRFLIGKTCHRTVLDRQNEIIIRKNGVVSQATLQKANRSGKLLELALSCKT